MRKPVLTYAVPSAATSSVASVNSVNFFNTTVTKLTTGQWIDRVSCR